MNRWQYFKLTNSNVSPFQIHNAIIRTRDTNIPALPAVHRIIHPHVGVHDLQRLALHSPGPRPGRRLLLLRLAQEHGRGRQRALPMIPSTLDWRQTFSLHQEDLRTRLSVQPPPCDQFRSFSVSETIQSQTCGWSYFWSVLSLYKYIFVPKLSSDLGVPADLQSRAYDLAHLSLHLQK